MNSSGDIVTFSSTGQIVIPRRLCQQFGIKNGTKAAVEFSEGTIILRPITREYIGKRYGKYRGQNLLRALSNEKKTEREQ